MNDPLGSNTRDDRDDNPSSTTDLTSTWSSPTYVFTPSIPILLVQGALVKGLVRSYFVCSCHKLYLILCIVSEEDWNCFILVIIYGMQDTST